MKSEIFLAISLILAFLSGIIINNFLIKRPLRFVVKKANISAIRFRSQLKPVFGGITFFVVFMCIIIASIFIFEPDAYLNNSELFLNPEFICLTIVVMLAFFMGLADDIISTPPTFKFFVQLICAIIFIYYDFYIHISPHEWINYLITIIWVVGMMNSINMLDNMDAVTVLTSLSIIGGVILFYLFGLTNSSIFLIFVLTGICGALLSFLFYNWHPARMYMGDSGSQFIGIILAFIGIVFFWNSSTINEPDYTYNIKQFIVIALAFLIPISDTTTVTINRLLKKQSPFVGDRNHTTHHLFYLGIPEKWIAVILFTLNSIGVVLALYIINMPNPVKISTLLYFASYPIVVFLLLFINTKISKQK